MHKNKCSSHSAINRNRCVLESACRILFYLFLWIVSGRNNTWEACFVCFLYLCPNCCCIAIKIHPGSWLEIFWYKYLKVIKVSVSLGLLLSWNIPLKNSNTETFAYTSPYLSYTSIWTAVNCYNCPVASNCNTVEISGKFNTAINSLCGWIP